uniref:Uncharacterized protein n=1 Tax=viral metagenome TaxID=1070528 RepID=A0A6C0D7I7_9ZZZZ
MFLVPYILIKKESIYPVYIFHIFLYQGTLLLQMNYDEINDFCNENEIYFVKKNSTDDYCYLEIDQTKTSLKNFYSYVENSEAECWRRFIMIGNNSEDYLHVNKTNIETIQPILKNILELHTE